MPSIQPSRKLDYELEMGFIYGGPSTSLGQRLSPSEANNHLFGLVVLNDWSARDIQRWEYVPLGSFEMTRFLNGPVPSHTLFSFAGPFLSKNFCTTISPWIVTCEALEGFKVSAYDHDPPLLEYLTETNGFNYDVELSIEIRGEWKNGP